MTDGLNYIILSKKKELSSYRLDFIYSSFCSSTAGPMTAKLNFYDVEEIEIQKVITHIKHFFHFS